MGQPISPENSCKVSSENALQEYTISYTEQNLPKELLPNKDLHKKQVIEAASKLIVRRQLDQKTEIFLELIQIKANKPKNTEIIDLYKIQELLMEGHRIILEAPLGAGKTTTLVQLTKQFHNVGQLAFFIDLPLWIEANTSILEYIASSVIFQSYNLDHSILTQLYNTEHFSFLLNGWNEIPENHSQRANRWLREVEQNFPLAGIIVATRTHYIKPPLCQAVQVNIKPLSKTQRNKYLEKTLGIQASKLNSEINNNSILDKLTRTPLILSQVVNIFCISNTVIATSKMEILGEVVDLPEKLIEHSIHLQGDPLKGCAQPYLTELAVEMTLQDKTGISEQDACVIVHSKSCKLKNNGQLVTLPEPMSILNTLCSHHILERSVTTPISFYFQHQQFQEFYVAMMLKNKLLVLINNFSEDKTQEFTKLYLNNPIWQESLFMIAEEIGIKAEERKTEDNLVEIGKQLIKMALTVDPIFAAKLSQLCGKLVWKEVGNLVSERLRSWYMFSDKYHKACALHGMIATGADDFIDIIQSFLTDEQGMQLIYTTRPEFHLSSFGAQWKSIIASWNEGSRITFISELLGNNWNQEIGEYFIHRDPSAKVRKEVIESLDWIGYEEDIVELLEQVNNELFEEIITKLSVDRVPLLFYDRAILAYEKLLNKSENNIKRLQILLNLAKLGDTSAEQKLKNELTTFKFGENRDLANSVIHCALKLLQLIDPEWVSLWVAKHIIDGSLWHEYWETFVIDLPYDFMESLLTKFSSEVINPNQKSKIISVLANKSNQQFAEAVFEKLHIIKHSISEGSTKENQDKKEIFSQLKDLFETIPPNIAVAGLSKCFTKECNIIDLNIIIDIFNVSGKINRFISNPLQDELSEKLRTYLRKGIKLVLEQSDFGGELKSNLVSTLARVGINEDITDIEMLIQADIQRRRKGLVARKLRENSELAQKALSSWSYWNVRSITSLGADIAEKVLLSLLQEPEYAMEAALGLVSLAKLHNNEPLKYKKDYSIIWKSRNGLCEPVFDEKRRYNYASKIEELILIFLEEYENSREKPQYSHRLEALTESLSILDSKSSAELLLQIISLFQDGWCISWQIKIIENLLFGGAALPTEKILPILNHIINHLSNQYQDPSSLNKCLGILPFIDNPSVGINKIREVITNLNISYYQIRYFISAIGESRCEEGFLLLKEIANNYKQNLSEIMEEWLQAITIFDNEESEQVLLSFIDKNVTRFSIEINFDYHSEQLLGKYIGALANKKITIKEHIIQLCNSQLSTINRSLLSNIIKQLGTKDIVLAGLSLIDDSITPTIPHYLLEAIEHTFVEHRPNNKTENSYSLVPRSCNEIRDKLFEMALMDTRRMNSAFSILGQLEVWRLLYGKPNDEPRHPGFDLKKPWPFIISKIQYTD